MIRKKKKGSVLMQRIKAKMAKLVDIKFASTNTKQGVLQHDEEEITEGTEVFIEDEDGALIPAPDGSYENETGEVSYVVENGVVQEVVGEENKEEKMRRRFSQEGIGVENQNGEYAEAEAFNKLVEVVKAIAEELSLLEEQIGSVETENDELKKQNRKFAKILKTSIDVPATQRDKEDKRSGGNDVTNEFFKYR